MGPLGAANGCRAHSDGGDVGSESMTILQHPKASERSLEAAIGAFLGDVEHANRSPHTRHAYGSDLAAFHRYYSRYYTGALDGITPDTLRGYFSTLSGLSPATRARKQVSLASFLAWAYTTLARPTWPACATPSPPGTASTC